MDRTIKMGMVGGGLGAFIGEVHRKAAALGGQIEWVCGVFNSEKENLSLGRGREWACPLRSSLVKYEVEEVDGDVIVPSRTDLEDVHF